MQITVITPGLLSTIQDLGRYQYLSQAVSVSGAMDVLSARIANKAVGNDDNAAVIEFTYADAEFKADSDLLIAYAGEGAFLVSDSKKLPPERPLFIPKGTSIKLIANPAGCRTYLSVAGGWDVPQILGSRSTFLTAGFGGFHGRALVRGDILNSDNVLANLSKQILNSLSGDLIKYPKWSIPTSLLLPANRKLIRVVPSQEFCWFAGGSISDFLSTAYIIGQRSNRMGYHLEGAKIHRIKTTELLSTALMPGTIQVTGEGSMIMLMADCQTTGGYPRIAQVAAVDLPLCAQLKPGNQIFFTAISRHDAEMLYLEREHELQLLTVAVQSKFY